MTTSPASIHCRIFRSDRKSDTYVYLREGFDVEELPDSIRSLLLPLVEVMEMDLNDQRKLANADAVSVIENLKGQGFYLQLPPQQIDPSKH